MGLSDTPTSNRIHIGFFGQRNAGKSSLVNAVTNQQISVVSDTLGTTTDPVTKAMELLPLGPVEIIDTPGYDDVGELGALRIKRTRQILNKTDIAVLVIDAIVGIRKQDKELISIFKEKEIPHIVVYNKADLVAKTDNDILYVSSKTGENINLLKERLARLSPLMQQKTLLDGIVQPDQLIVLVIPIDEAAPKGRLILPQQQTIRDILDKGAYALCVKNTEYKELLDTLPKNPDLVICDSQVFKEVDEKTPADVLLTSFSILFARQKGDLKTLVSGVRAIDTLTDGDTILISEGCTHHRQCNDIGTVKLPNLIRKFTNKSLNFEFTQGIDYADDFSKYKLIIHCGGCMLNEKEMKHRIKVSQQNNIPITNYGTAIAYMNGILQRSTAVFSGLF